MPCLCFIPSPYFLVCVLCLVCILYPVLSPQFAVHVLYWPIHTLWCHPLMPQTVRMVCLCIYAPGRSQLVLVTKDSFVSLVKNLNNINNVCLKRWCLLFWIHQDKTFPWQGVVREPKCDAKNCNVFWKTTFCHFGKVWAWNLSLLTEKVQVFFKMRYTCT